MKLIGKLKNQVDKAQDKEEARKLIAKAGMELTDKEMKQVSGGGQTFTSINVFHRCE